MDVEEVTYLDAVAVTGRVLGALFYYAPHSPQAAPLVAMLAAQGAAHWPAPCERRDDIARQLRCDVSPAGETRAAAWQRLFIGPDALPAPPWGSVWLDKDNVLFGESMLALRRWMTDNGIDFHTAQNEPCDHIGILLLLAAWLAESGREQLLTQLLAWHVLPWSARFLEVFIERAGHPFYIAVGRLARLTLHNWQSAMPIAVAEKELFL